MELRLRSVSLRPDQIRTWSTKEIDDVLGKAQALGARTQLAQEKLQNIP